LLKKLGYLKGKYSPTKTAVEYLEQFIIFTIVLDKLSHFMHAGHSVSLYLEGNCLIK
jgi:hypothetical protein